MKVAVQILYWADIPVQVKAKKGRARISQELPQRFQVAIDQAAMEAGLVGSDAYTDQFHWSDPVLEEGELDDIVSSLIHDLDAQFARIDWRQTAKMLKEKGV